MIRMILWITAAALLLGGCSQTVETPPDAVIATAAPTEAALATLVPPTASPDQSGYPAGDAVPPVVATATEAPAGYPAAEPAAGQPGASYPGAGERLSELPDPARNLPDADADTGVVGGTLIEEFSQDGTYLPLQPIQLILAGVIDDGNEQPGFIRYNDSSPRAETFPTGVFIFNDVPPGDYGLVVNVGYAEFAVLADSGEQLLITVEAGEVVDLGQVIVELP